MDINKNPLLNHPLQTSYWANFRKEWGNDVRNEEFGIIIVHKIPLLGWKLGMYQKGRKPDKDLFDKLNIFADQNNLFFIKMEPNYFPKDQKEKENMVKFLKKQGCVSGKTIFTPSTFYIDLKKSEEDLLKSFHSKTRYNIRYSEKKGVKVVEDNSKKAFDTYLRLTQETAKRQGFFAHNARYHNLMWKNLHTNMVQKGKKPIARLLCAKYKGEILTTWVVFAWKDTLYYPYGASSKKHQNLQANSLMMWSAILYGKKLGLKIFDLWGREPGKGFTKFKEGFSPKVIEFIGTWDFVIGPKYKVYLVLEKLRWLILKLRALVRKTIPSNGY